MNQEAEAKRLRLKIAELESRLSQMDAGGTADPYRELFEQSADAILIIEEETFVDCNQATVDMLRYQNKEELLQTHPSELSPEFQPDGRRSYEKAEELIVVAFEKGSHRFEWEHIRADGEVFPVEVLLTAVSRGERRILHVVWRDITERKRLQEDLQQAQKMEAIGRLSGGIAHDFNNLLVAILGHLELLELEPLSADTQKGHINEIRRAGEQAAELVAQLLAFSRRQVLQPRVIDLNELVSQLQGILTRLIGEDIQIEWQPHPTALAVLTDPGQLSQVILNLVTNARDAMPKGGTISLRSSSLQLEKPIEVIGSELPPGTYVQLAVQDTGEGIAAGDLSRIFDPFYTTKPREEGTGLGLASAHGILHQSDGAIAVETKVGKGSTFTILLPLSDETPSPLTDEHENRPSEASLEGSESILVVEDEEAVGNLVEHVLKRQGYTVHRAENGRDALERIQAEGMEFDLLLTDVVMPELGGPELAAKLKLDRPQLKVLFASGYTDDALMRSGALQDEVELILKPFSPHVLLQRVREILDREP